MSKNKLFLGAAEAILFAQDSSYWALKPLLEEIEKIAPAGKVSLVLPNGSRAHFLWGGFAEEPPATGIEVREVAG